MPVNIPYQSKNNKKAQNNLFEQLRSKKDRSINSSNGNSKSKKNSFAKDSQDKKNDANVFKTLFFLLLGLIIGGIGMYFLSEGYGLSNLQEFEISDVKTLFSGLESVSKQQKSKTTLCIQKNLPIGLSDDVRNWTDTFEDEEFEIQEFVDDPADACEIVVSIKDFGGYDLAWRKYYVAVTSQTSSLNAIDSDEFQQLAGGGEISRDDQLYSLIIGKFAKSFMEKYFGLGVTVPVVDDVANSLEENPGSIGIIPFEDLSYEMRIVEVAGVSLLNFEKDSESGFVTQEDYLLSEGIWVEDPDNLGLFAVIKNSMGPTNYDPQKVTTVVVTGTSVMGGRGLYQKIQETDDPIYPIRGVAEVLQKADIAHISNEAAFAKECVQYAGTLTFCGPAESLDGFTYAGVDVVGLTGNHILDAGVEEFLQTLKMYNEAGIEYFGGGKNLKDASQPAIIEVNGLKFGFLGYNAIPPADYFATESNPGSMQMDTDRMIKDIQSASGKVDYLFVDMQWGMEYQHKPIAHQVEHGYAAIDAGADFVTGVHPHWVQPVEEYKNGLIFYSLGNLLFDQMWSRKTREGVMIEHIFYDKEYLGFKVIPTMIFEGAQPRVVEGEDASRIRNYVFGNY